MDQDATRWVESRLIKRKRKAWVISTYMDPSCPIHHDSWDRGVKAMIEESVFGLSRSQGSSACPRPDPKYPASETTVCISPLFHHNTRAAPVTADAAIIA